jgi:hypothetical protein
MHESLYTDISALDSAVCTDLAGATHKSCVQYLILLMNPAESFTSLSVGGHRARLKQADIDRCEIVTQHAHAVVAKVFGSEH